MDSVVVVCGLSKYSFGPLKECAGPDSCGDWALVALRHVESSQIREGTRVPCVARWILTHCTTREVLQVFLWLRFFSVVEFHVFEPPGSVLGKPLI